LIFADRFVRMVEQTGRPSLLEVAHLSQSSMVQYNVHGWAKTVHMSSRTLQLQALLQTSTKYILSAFTLAVVHSVCFVFSVVM